MLCIGHRGAAGHEPENTLRSVRRALDMGVDGIEVDIYCIHGRLIVIHDPTLDRTTNGAGPLRRLPLAQLRALDAGKGEPIPFLEEVIELINRRAFLNIELKGPRTGPPVLDLLTKYLARGWSPADFLLSSFRKRELTPYLATEFPTGLLQNFPRLRTPLPCTNIHLPLSRVTPAVVQRIHAAGKKLYVFTVNTRPDMDRLAALGVDAIFTDFPDLWTGNPYKK